MTDRPCDGFKIEEGKWWSEKEKLQRGLVILKSMLQQPAIDFNELRHNVSYAIDMIVVMQAGLIQANESLQSDSLEEKASETCSRIGELEEGAT